MCPRCAPRVLPGVSHRGARLYNRRQARGSAEQPGHASPTSRVPTPRTRPLTATASPGRHGRPAMCPATATSAPTAAAHTARRGCGGHHRGKLPAHLSRRDRPRDTGPRVCRDQEGRGILWDSSLATWERVLLPRQGIARLKMELSSLSCCLPLLSLPHSSGLVCCSI